MKNGMDQKTVEALTRFSFIATLIVVICHTDDVMSQSQRTFFVRFLGGWFSDSNVCNFFFLSGFFVARHFGEKSWWVNELKKRIVSLSLPYALWCLIYFMFFSFSTLFGSDGIKPELSFGTVKRIFGIGLLASPCCFVLWYVKTLLYFILVSPVVFYICEGSFCKLCMTILAILAFRVLGCGLHLSVMPYFGFCFHLLGFIAFMCGSWCALHGSEFSDRMKSMHPLVPLSLWIGTSLACCFFGCRVKGLAVVSIPVNIAISVFCLLWIWFASKLIIPAAIAKCTVFIYAAHLLFLNVFANAARGLTVCIPPELLFVLLLSASVAACIVIAHVIGFLSPRAAGLLSGGRFDKVRYLRKETL